MVPLGEMVLVVELERDSRRNSILSRSLFPTLISFNNLFNNVLVTYFSVVSRNSGQHWHLAGLGAP